VKINARPHLFEFLAAMSQVAELILFTASHKVYSEKVLECLDPKHEIFSFVFSNENCIITEDDVHIKDLRVIGNRELADLAFVDNSSYCFIA